MLVHFRKIIEKTKRALGAFDTFNFEITRGIIEGAVQEKSSIIVQITPKTMEYAGTETITQIIKSIADNQGRGIEIALHLDHGRTLEEVKQCIALGFSSVMIDASNKSFKDNIRLTKEAVKYAHHHNVFVQAELGVVGRGKKDYQKMILSPEEFLTDPDQAQEFVKKTKVDTLAIAIGNVHGHYKMEKGAPKLFLSVLEEIKKKIDIPLVLHGASGIAAGQIKQAINLGIKIINIDTEIRMAFKKALKKSLKDQKKELDPRKILAPTIEEVKKVVRNKIKIFNQ
ncbi:MAG: class II fructose-bisphosphate aldolase family protein [Patescibacteria group bacterium]|jgi:fructose/tagatose bisphosphate aldolase|nr:class II fructose-bisphosphate aldolase family protein [Patescibacteria group bacterium]MDD5172541.1 class II fructose-bisphosphate aldolase family protein [Patescibacteria group bacterium]